MTAACALVERGHSRVFEYGMSLFVDVLAADRDLHRQPR